LSACGRSRNRSRRIAPVVNGVTSSTAGKRSGVFIFRLLPPWRENARQRRGGGRGNKAERTADWIEHVLI
jgi:hypothetical protein